MSRVEVGQVWERLSRGGPVQWQVLEVGARYVISSPLEGGRLQGHIRCSASPEMLAADLVEGGWRVAPGARQALRHLRDCPQCGTTGLYLLCLPRPEHARAILAEQRRGP